MSRKLKIIMVEIAGRGGICHYAYNLSLELGQSTQIMLVTGKDYELKDKKRNFELVEMFNRLKTNPFILFELTRIFKDKEVDIVHFQASQYPVFVLLLACLGKAAGKKIVITAHNVVSHENKIWEQWIYRKLYEMASGIIVHARANKEELLKMFRVDEVKISVIPHGNYMFFSSTDKNTLVDTDENSILFFGYIREYKGLIHLIRALKIVTDKIAKAKLLIVGRPVENFQKYRDEIEKLQLKNNVELRLDYVPFEEVKDYFSRAAVVALPYEKIYQSGVLQLAYGFGKPVVVTDTGGLPEAVEHGENGFIVPVGDIEALAKALINVLLNVELKEKMGKRSLELAETKFSWSHAAGLTKNLYDSLTTLNKQ
ncbi:MAG: glycosyltransferase family 4 protein [Candidatus Omnitrophica bacterium]|nr:glycosyltransferase family 4 protein [Candidatus Omnitrophota bacterium]